MHDEPAKTEFVGHHNIETVDETGAPVGVTTMQFEPPKPEDTLLTLHSLGRVMVEINYKGEIHYGADYTPDEASKAFWDVIVNGMPDHLRMAAVEYNPRYIEKAASAIADYLNRMPLEHSGAQAPRFNLSAFLANDGATELAKRALQAVMSYAKEADKRVDSQPQPVAQV